MMKKVKKKVNLKGFLFIILIIYLLGSFIYYLFNLPIKNIEIIGNVNLTDEEIINTAGISDYPNIFKVPIYKIKNNLMSLDLVNKVKIRKNLLGKITIIVSENKILFYNQNTDKIILENGKAIDNNNYLGYGYLINIVPSDIYDELIKGLAKIDQSILSKISEIEYDPDIKDDIILDEERFLLRMNDKNTIYINIANINKLAKYNEIYEVLDINKPGTLYLDSASKNTHFVEYNN